MENGKSIELAGCISRAQDVVPFTGNSKEAYEELRLDYAGSPYKEKSEKGKSVYVIRCTCDYRPTNEEYPKVDADNWWNNPPCTGQGFTGSEEVLIPEYTYGYDGQKITNGVIYKIDKDGNESLAATWNKRKEIFELVEKEQICI